MDLGIVTSYLIALRHTSIFGEIRDKWTGWGIIYTNILWPNIDLCPQAIELEMRKQESLLAELHAEISSGVTVSKVKGVQLKIV